MKYRLLGLLAVITLASSLTGCGPAYQSYEQGLTANQNTFDRQQKILDAKNDVAVAQLQVQAATAQANVNIAIAKGKAEAQEIQTRSLKPLFVEQELVDAIADGKVQTLVLPQNQVLPLNFGTTNGEAQK